MKKIIMLCITIITMVGSVVTYADVDSVDENQIQREISDRYNVIYSDEWKKMEYIDQVKYINSDAKDVSKLKTETLIALFAKYPFNSDYLMYNKLEDGIDHLIRTSTLFAELIKRPDLVVALNNSKVELDDTGMILWNIISKDLLRYLGGNIKISSYNVNKLMKMNQNRINAAVGFVTRGYNTTINNNVIVTVGDYYKYGTSEFCYKYVSGDYSTSQINAMIANMHNNHPSWVYIAPPTNKYNCHSYAWIDTATTNIYWINYPNNFKNSTGYVTRTGVNAPVIQGNSRVVLDGAAGSSVHSVIANATTTLGSSSTIMQNTSCISKLRDQGVYRTSLKDMYDFYGGTSYSVYVINWYAIIPAESPTEETVADISVNDEGSEVVIIENYNKGNDDCSETMIPHGEIMSAENDYEKEKQMIKNELDKLLCERLNPGEYINYWSVISVFGVDGIDYKAVSLMNISGAPDKWSIFTYMMFITGMRIVYGIVIVLTAFALSTVVKNLTVTIVMLTAIFLAPLLLVYLGLTNAELFVFNPLVLGNSMFIGW